MEEMLINTLMFSSAQVCGMGLIEYNQLKVTMESFRPLRFAEWG